MLRPAEGARGGGGGMLRASSSALLYPPAPAVGERSPAACAAGGAACCCCCWAASAAARCCRRARSCSLDCERRGRIGGGERHWRRSSGGRAAGGDERPNGLEVGAGHVFQPAQARSAQQRTGAQAKPQPGAWCSRRPGHDHSLACSVCRTCRPKPNAARADGAKHVARWPAVPSCFGGLAILQTAITRRSSALQARWRCAPASPAEMQPPVVPAALQSK